MAVEKGKVLAELNKKYQGKSISKTFKENLAAKWAEKIDTDDDIAGYIEDRDDLILEAAGEADRRANDAAAKAKADAAKKITGDGNEPNPADDDDPDMPAWYKKSLAAQNKRYDDLMQEVTGLKTSTAQKSISERFAADMKEKGVPELVWKARVPKTEEEYQQTVTDVIADYTAFAQERKLDLIGRDNPGGGTGGEFGKKGEVDPDLVNFAKSQNEAAKAETK